MIIRALYSVNKLDVSVLPLSFYVTRTVSEIDGSLSLAWKMLMSIDAISFGIEVDLIVDVKYKSVFSGKHRGETFSTLSGVDKLASASLLFTIYLRTFE